MSLYLLWLGVCVAALVLVCIFLIIDAGKRSWSRCAARALLIQGSLRTLEQTQRKAERASKRS